MTKKITIAIDAMGGENSPDKILEAISNVVVNDDQLFFNIFGDVNLIKTKLLKYKIPNNRYEVFNAEENITDDEGYFSLYLAADLREVKWEYECKIQVIKEEDIDQDEFTAEVLVGQGDDEVELMWSLPHNKVLEFKK